MAFVLSGTVITQSGTDADLSGIAGISGVESYDHGVTDFDYTIYDASDFELVITGTLDHNQFEEQLIVDQLTINDGGTYNLGITKPAPSNSPDVFEAFVPLLALNIKARGAHPQDDPRFIINSGGTLVWKSAMILLHSGMRGYWTSASDQANVTISDAYLYIEGLATGNNKPYKLRFDGTTVNIDKLKQYGGAFTNQLVLDSFSGYEPTHFWGIQVPGQASDTELFIFTNYAGGGRGNEQDCRWTRTRMKFKNSATGSNLILKTHGSGAVGMADVTKEMQLTITDSDAVAIVGARYYIKDYDSGVRADYTYSSNNIIYDADRPYTGITDAAGVTPTAEVLTLAVVDNGANNDGSTKDYRSKNNNTDDLFDIFIWSYAHLSAIVSQELKGIDVLNIPWTLFADNSITEADQTITAAYTGIVIDHTLNSETITITESHTLDEIYDFIKHNKTLAANISFPTPGTLAVSASGNKLQFGDYSLIISGATTTLSAGATFTNMSSDGTITTAADGTITVPFADSTGTQLIIKTNPTDAFIRVEEYNAANDTLLNTYTGSTDATSGTFSQKFAADAMVRIYLKKHGYFFSRTNHNMIDGTEIDIALIVIAHIDTTPMLDDYTESTTDYENSLYFEFENNHGNWVCGEINTSGRFIVTASLLDHRISTQIGLEFYAWYNVQSDVGDHLGGRPYTWNHDRLEINEEHMQFTRISGMVGTEISRIGVPIKKRDGITNYIAPESQNSRVGFDNVAILIPVSSLEEIVDQTRDEIERDDGPLDFIKKLQSADIVITNTTITFSYGDDTLLVFDKRTATTDADYSGGRERDTTPL